MDSRGMFHAVGWRYTDYRSVFSDFSHNKCTTYKLRCALVFLFKCFNYFTNFSFSPLLLIFKGVVIFIMTNKQWLFNNLWSDSEVFPECIGWLDFVIVDATSANCKVCLKSFKLSNIGKQSIVSYA